MAKTMLLPVVILFVTAGCGSPPDKQSSSNDLIRLEVTNWSFVSKGPIGLIVSVPKDCKTVPQVPGMLEGASKNKTYNIPVNIATDKGAILTWFYGPTYAESSPQQNEDERKSVLSSGKPIKEIGDWKGVVTDGGDQGNMSMIDEKSPKAESQIYMMYRRDDQLMVVVKWPTGNSGAKASGIAAAESFVKTAEINDKAKKIDFFPGADDEPNMPIPPGTEIAMEEGMTIEATTKNGVINIHAGPDLKRTYTWEGASRFVIMEPRADRWYGSKGMYYPGPGDHWEEHNGITRGVLEEGQQNFESEAEAIKWLKERDYIAPVWNHTGLVVGWMKVLERNQLDVEVWQITIKHKKPTSLLGSTDAAIKIVK